MKKFALLTVVAALFAAPAFARQSMNMTGMENTVGVLSSVTHPLLVRVGSDPQHFGGNPGHCSAIPRRQTAGPRRRRCNQGIFEKVQVADALRRESASPRAFALDIIKL